MGRNDNFIRNFGLTVDEGSGKARISVSYGGPVDTLWINANDTIQGVIGRIAGSAGPAGVDVFYDEASGQIVAAQKSNNEPVELTITDMLADNTEISTQVTRIGPMYSFNGRSGMVVPQAGDYTPEMVGLSIAADEEVTEMLAEVFGAAE